MMLNDLPRSSNLNFHEEKYNVNKNKNVFKQCLEIYRSNTDGPSRTGLKKQQLEQNRMKRIWNVVVDFADSIARARAASAFARMGRADLAREIMMKD